MFFLSGFAYRVYTIATAAHQMMCSEIGVKQQNNYKFLRILYHALHVPSTMRYVKRYLVLFFYSLPNAYTLKMLKIDDTIIILIILLYILVLLYKIIYYTNIYIIHYYYNMSMHCIIYYYILIILHTYIQYVLYMCKSRSRSDTPQIQV